MVVGKPTPVAWMQVYTNAQGQELYAFSKERNSEKDIGLYVEDVVMEQASRIANLESRLSMYKDMWRFEFSKWAVQDAAEGNTK